MLLPFFLFFFMVFWWLRYGLVQYTIMAWQNPFFRTLCLVASFISARTILLTIDQRTYTLLNLSALRSIPIGFSITLTDVFALIWIMGVAFQLGKRLDNSPRDISLLSELLLHLDQIVFWWLPIAPLRISKGKVQLAVVGTVLCGLSLLPQIRSTVCEQWSEKIVFSYYHPSKNKDLQLWWGATALPLVSLQQSVPSMFVPAIKPELLSNYLKDPLWIKDTEATLVPNQTFSGFIVPSAAVMDVVSFDSQFQFSKWVSENYETQAFTAYVKLFVEGVPYLSAFTVGEPGDFAMHNHAFKSLVPQKLSWTSAFQRGIIYGQEDAYMLAWDKIFIPLEKNGNPMAYGGGRQISADELIVTLNKGIQVFKNGETVDVTSLHMGIFQALDPYEGLPGAFHRRSLEKDTNGFFRLVVQLKQLGGAWYIPQDQISYLLGLNMDAWTIHIWGDGDGFQMNSINIDIIDPKGPYDPPVQINNPNQFDLKETWQMYARETGKSWIKMDTTLARNKRIADIYQDTQKYTILHIPKFQTLERLRNEKEDPLKGIETKLITLWNAPLSPERLNEWCPDDRLQLQWGQWTDILPSEGLNITTMIKQRAMAPTLFSDLKDTFTFQQGRITFFEEGSVPQVFQIDNWQSPEFQQRWLRLKPRTAVLVDKVVAKDANGVAFHFPYAWWVKTAGR